MENVNHPKHYTSSPSRCECGKGIECIQITQHMNFCIGNAIKYLWRADHKDAPIQDLEKAVWYICKEIDLRKREWKRRQEEAKGQANNVVNQLRERRQEQIQEPLSPTNGRSEGP